MAHHIAIKKQEEGLVDGLPDTPGLDPYLCPAQVATIGWGHAVVDPRTGKQLRGATGLARARELYPNGITRDEAERLLAEDEAKFARYVDEAGLKLTDNQRSAFISLSYNIGSGAWRNSSAFEMAQRGKHAQVPDCIRRWCKSRKSLQGPLEWTKGLAIRREIEARLYATPDDAPFDPLAIRKEMEALWRDR